VYRQRVREILDIPSQDTNSIFFRNIRLPSKYLMAPFNSRFQPYKVTFFFQGVNILAAIFLTLSRVDCGLLQTISEMEKKSLLTGSFGRLLYNLLK